MAWGGGIYTTMNKILPGVYTNVKSAGEIKGIGADRGTVGIGIPGMIWGPEGAFKMTAGEFYENGDKYFGVGPMDESLRGVRDLFEYAHTGYFFRLGASNKASVTPITAKYGGSFGNNITVSVTNNVDGIGFNVEVFVKGKSKLMVKGIATPADMPDNDYITWDPSALTFNAGLDYVLVNGAEVALDDTTEKGAYVAMQTALEPYSDIDAIGCISTIEDVKTAFVQYINRLVSEKGRSVQGVVFNKKADTESIVNVKNSADLVYWATGAVGGCKVNKSLTGKKYGGGFVIPADYTSAELEVGIEEGEFILHRVGDGLVVLKDINSLTSLTLEKGAVMANNQVIRAINTFIEGVKQSFITTDLGSTPNSPEGRASVKSRVIDVGRALVDAGAFYPFGNDAVAVDRVVGDLTAIKITAIMQPSQAIEKLYINLIVE